MKAKSLPPPETDYGSTANAVYAERLKTFRKLGKILYWDYEIATFRIARGVRYKPDFMIIRNDLTIEFHEVKVMRKASRKERIRDPKAGKKKWRTHPGDRDTRTRIHVAADRLPHFRWIVAWKDGSSFELEVIE